MATGSNAPFSGDHTDLENVKDGQHHSAVSPDKATIVKNSNGNLAVEKPSSEFIGDFEIDLGDWSIDSGNSRQTTNQSVKGSGSVELADTSKISRTVDVTGIDSLVFYAKDISGGNPVVTGNLNGSTVVSKQLTSSAWVKYEVSLDSYSGNTKIGLEQLSTETATWVAAVDSIKLVKSQKISVDSGAGN